MPMSGFACLSPGSVGLIQSFDSVPVQERARIKKDDQEGPGSGGHPKIEIIPMLSGHSRMGRRAKPIGNVSNGYRHCGAPKMNDISFLRQDHSGYGHDGAPQISA